MGEPTVGGLTPQQLTELTQALTAQQAESSRLSRLQLAKELISPCDGTQTDSTRRWVRQLQISHNDNDNTDSFTIQLAKITARDDLLESICTSQKTTWAELKTHVISAFLTGAEDLTYRQQLSQCRQKDCETIQSYSSRFKSIYQLAYPDAPGATL